MQHPNIISFHLSLVLPLPPLFHSILNFFPSYMYPPLPFLHLSVSSSRLSLFRQHPSPRSSPRNSGPNGVTYVAAFTSPPRVLGTVSLTLAHLKVTICRYNTLIHHNTARGTTGFVHVITALIPHCNRHSRNTETIQSTTQTHIHTQHKKGSSLLTQHTRRCTQTNTYHQHANRRSEKR